MITQARETRDQNPILQMYTKQDYSPHEVITKKSRKKWVCLSFISVSCCIFFIILASVGVTVYFLYPRIPTLSVNSSSLLFKSINPSTHTIDLAYHLNITVGNQNYLTLKASSIVANMSTQGQQIGIIKYNQTLTFPGRTSTSYDIVMMFKPTNNNPNAAYSIARNCSASRSHSIDLLLNGIYDINVNGLSFTYHGTWTKDDTERCFGTID